MYKHHSTWILVITLALFALPALAADEVVPATSEDIEAFDKALTRTRQQERTGEQAPSATQDRTRTRAEMRNEKGEGEPTGDAAQTKARVQTRTRAEKRLNTAVSEEADKMKSEQAQVQERTRVRSEQQLEEGQGTMERSRAMRDYSGGEGERAGQGGPPEGSGQGGPSEGSGSGGSGSSGSGPNGNQ
jgi:hypothetical protein